MSVELALAFGGLLLVTVGGCDGRLSGEAEHTVDGGGDGRD
jgi:hypothetical protein